MSPINLLLQQCQEFQGAFKLRRTIGASVTLHFTGRSVSLPSTSGSSHGKLDIYLDNGLVGTLDQRTSTVFFKSDGGLRERSLQEHII